MVKALLMAATAAVYSGCSRNSSRRGHRTPSTPGAAVEAASRWRIFAPSTRVADPDPIQSGQSIRIRIQEGKNDPQK
jgi:hypothetical protein